MPGADSVEKLEDGIVRSAEQVSGQIRAAKEAISTVIFGQERVIEKYPGDDSVRRSCVADRGSGPCQDQAGRNARHHARPGRQAHPVHAGPDAVGYSGRRGAGRKQFRQAVVPLHLGPGVCPAADGRRNQPRQPAHPVGVAAGDAGAAHHRGRCAPRSAKAVPRARDAKSAGAGRHLSTCRKRSSIAS